MKILPFSFVPLSDFTQTQVCQVLLNVYNTAEIAEEFIPPATNAALVASVRNLLLTVTPGATAKYGRLLQGMLGSAIELTAHWAGNMENGDVYKVVSCSFVSRNEKYYFFLSNLKNVMQISFIHVFPI